MRINQMYLIYIAHDILDVHQIKLQGTPLRTHGQYKQIDTRRTQESKAHSAQESRTEEETHGAARLRQAQGQKAGTRYIEALTRRKH